MNRRRHSPATAEISLETTHWWLWLVPAALASALYLPMAGAGLVWDDSIVLKQQLPAFTGVRELFMPPPGIPQWPEGYYRPAVIASHLLDRALFGDSPRGPHLTGVALHAAATAFAALLAAAVLRGRRHRAWGALAAGLLFAGHPIHTESVCWITGRSDPLAAAMLLPALVLGISYRDRRSRGALAASAALFLAALLAKEVAVAGLALLPLLLAATPRPGEEREAVSAGRRLRGSVPLLALWAAASAIYFALRAAAGASAGRPAEMLAALDGRIADLVAAVAFYLRALAVPFPQSSFVATLPSGLAVVAAWAALAALTLWAVRSWRRGEPLWGLGLAWFAASLAPSLTPVVLRVAETPVAERYLYLPSWGFCLLAGAALAEAGRSPARRRLAAGVAVALVAGFAVATLLRGQIWTNGIALWSDATAKAPAAALPWSELGRAYLDRGGDGDLDRALAAYGRAVALDDDPQGRAIALNSIAVIHARRGDEDEAAAKWRAAVAADPGYALAHFNLGNLLAHRAEERARREGRLDPAALDEAMAALRRAVEIDPRYLKALLRLLRCEVEIGLHYRSAGDAAAARRALDEAERIHSRLLELAPGTPLAAEAQRWMALAGAGGSGAVPATGRPETGP